MRPACLKITLKWQREEDTVLYVIAYQRNPLESSCDLYSQDSKLLQSRICHDLIWNSVVRLAEMF